MNSRSTAWLVALALGLFAYIMLIERPLRRGPGDAGAPAPLLPGFDPALVTGIEIHRSNNVIQVERTNGLWRLSQLNYPAQSSVVDNWLQVVAKAHRRTQISARDLLAEPGGAAAFGMESPAAIVTIQQGGRSFQFRVGNPTAVGDMLYVQSVGEDGLQVTEAALGESLPASTAAWRDPAFVSLAGLKFNRLTVRSGGRDVELQRDPTNRLWRLTRPRPARADNNWIEQMFQQLQAARVTQFVSDVPGSDLEPFGLQPPELLVSLAEGTNQVLTLEFGRSPTNDSAAVFARRSTHPSIVTVPREATSRLRAPYTDFLDRQLIDIGPDTVSRIEIRAAEEFALQKQTNGSWRVVEPVAFPADPGLVAYFFTRLSSLQIADVVKEVVTDLELPTYGLAPPRRQYALKRLDAAGETNVIVGQVDFGIVQGGRVFARRSDENSVYALQYQDTLELPQRAFEFRDRRIWQFTSNQVAGLSVTIGTNHWKLLRTGDAQWKLAPGSQGIVNPFALEEAVYQLGQLWSRAWITPVEGRPDPFGFGAAASKLSIQLDSGDPPRVLTVEFGKASPSGGPFARTELEGGPAVFEFPFKIFHAYEEAIRTLNAGAHP